MSNQRRKDRRIAELESKVRALERMVERIDADRKTFVRNQQTPGRHVRRVLAEKKTLMTLVQQSGIQIPVLKEAVGG